VWPALAGYTDNVRRSVRDRWSWEELIAKVRRGPPWLLRPVDAPMNTVEFFIHVEDVRRAQAGWEPRFVAPELADALWARVRAGDPGELTLFGAGRQEAAQVEISGDDALIAQLRSASLGI
jgi:hypothetical protein